MSKFDSQQKTAKYKGMTKKKYQKLHGSSTRGSEKGENCQASAVKKGLIKYPRWYKKDPALYMAINALTDKGAKGRKSLCGGTL